jgi:hypothetical protein
MNLFYGSEYIICIKSNTKINMGDGFDEMSFLKHLPNTQKMILSSK